MIYAVLVSLATAKVASMPIRSYDTYFYSYLASGENPDSFKGTPGLPVDWQRIPTEDIVRSRGFFTVKPLFVQLTRMAAIPVGILRAPFLVSALAYFCLGWVVWAWLGQENVHGLWRVIAGCLLLFTSVVTDTAREGTPDMLCTVLLVAGAWLLLSTKVKYLGIFLLLISVFGRTDSVVFGGMLLVLATWRRRISLASFAVSSALLVSCDELVAHQGFPYWEFVSATLRTSYVQGLIHNFVKTELAIYVPFVFLGVMALKAKFQQDLVLVCFASWIVRYILLPHLEVRYLLPQAVVLGVAAAGMGLARGRVIPLSQVDGPNATKELVQLEAAS